MLSFSIDETHPHGLIYASYESCLDFKRKYESSTVHYIAATRRSLDDVVFELDFKKIEDETYLKNVAVYTVIQATKDGKRTMPYDYKWGTGSMYFRPRNNLSIWEIDDSGNRCVPMRYGDMSYREQRKFTSSKSHDTIPPDWLVCKRKCKTPRPARATETGRHTQGGLPYVHETGGNDGEASRK